MGGEKWLIHLHLATLITRPRGSCDVTRLTEFRHKAMSM